MLPEIKLKFLAIFLLISLTNRAQVAREITLRIQANNIPDTAAVYISGNTPELGNWQPGEISLINTADNYWEKTFLFPEGKHIEFKITLGTWGSEAVKENGEIPGNNKLVVQNDTIVELALGHWKMQYKYELKGQVTGKVDRYKDIKGEGLLPRDLLVWLPPGYANDTTLRYPVLYMQDGQNLFDPSTSAFGTDWQIDEAADSLIKTGRMEPIIIVGLANTKWRMSEYSDNDTGYAYMRFIVDKVKPFIDSAYRTLPDPEHTAAGGSSLGGLISFILVWNYPEVFSMVVCMSPSLKIYHFDYVRKVRMYSGPHKNLRFYFDAGINSPDSVLVTGTQQMVDALLEQDYTPGRDIIWFKDKEGMHNEASWAKRVWRPLLFFFGKNQ